MAVQVTQTKTLKSTRDANLKRLSTETIAKIKKQRKAFNAKVKKQQARLDAKLRPHGDHKLQKKLTPQQLQRREKTIKRNIAQRRKLKYQTNGGDIAYGKVIERIDPKDWQNNFTSSNVWKFIIKGKNLLVAFLDGSIYLYFGASKLFLGMVRTGSKGKYIWKNLRRKGVQYLKIK